MEEEAAARPGAWLEDEEDAEEVGEEAMAYGTALLGLGADEEHDDEDVDEEEGDEQVRMSSNGGGRLISTRNKQQYAHTQVAGVGGDDEDHEDEDEEEEEEGDDDSQYEPEDDEEEDEEEDHDEEEEEEEGEEEREEQSDDEDVLPSRKRQKVATGGLPMQSSSSSSSALPLPQPPLTGLDAILARAQVNPGERPLKKPVLQRKGLKKKKEEEEKGPKPFRTKPVKTEKVVRAMKIGRPRLAISPSERMLLKRSYTKKHNAKRKKVKKDGNDDEVGKPRGRVGRPRSSVKGRPRKYPKLEESEDGGGIVKEEVPVEHLSELFQGALMNKTGYAFARVLEALHWQPDKAHRLPSGHDLTMEWVQTHGLQYPVIVTSPEVMGLGDTSAFSASPSSGAVCSGIGEGTQVRAHNASLIKPVTMRMAEWVKYWDDHTQRAQRRLTLTLDLQGTPLAQNAQAPLIVRQLDWEETLMPAHMKASVDMGGKTLLQYAAEGSFQDFIVAPGGASTWMHLVSGHQALYLVPPTEANLVAQEYRVQKGCHRTQANFLPIPVPTAGSPDCCHAVELKEGETLLLPAGWAHAIHAAVDSVALVGRFYHSFSGALQVRCIDLPASVTGQSDAARTASQEHTQRLTWYAIDHYHRLLCKEKDAGHTLSAMEEECVQWCAHTAKVREKWKRKTWVRPPECLGTPPAQGGVQSAPPVKRKRGRPPKHKPKQQPEIANEAHITAPDTQPKDQDAVGVGAASAAAEAAVTVTTQQQVTCLSADAGGATTVEEAPLTQQQQQQQQQQEGQALEAAGTDAMTQQQQQQQQQEGRSGVEQGPELMAPDDTASAVTAGKKGDPLLELLKTVNARNMPQLRGLRRCGWCVEVAWMMQGGMVPPDDTPADSLTETHTDADTHTELKERTDTHKETNADTDAHSGTGEGLSSARMDVAAGGEEEGGMGGGGGDGGSDADIGGCGGGGGGGDVAESSMAVAETAKGEGGEAGSGGGQGDIRGGGGDGHGGSG